MANVQTAIEWSVGVLILFAVLLYFMHIQYLSKIIHPTQILGRHFGVENTNFVIKEDGEY